MGQLAKSGLPTMRMGGAGFALRRLGAVSPQEEGWHEPYDGRLSRTILGGTGGEIPPVYSALETEDRDQTH